MSSLSPDKRAYDASLDAVPQNSRAFRIMADRSRAGILVHRDLVPLYANLACAKLFGFEGPGDLLALEDLAGLIPEEEQARLRAFQDRPAPGRNPGAAEPAPPDYDMAARTRDGKLLMLQNCSHRFEWEGEAAVCTTLLVQEERESVPAAAEQRSKADLLEMTLEAMGDGLAVFDVNGRLVLWNEAYFEMFGFPDEYRKAGIPGELFTEHSAEQGLFAPEDLSKYLEDVSNHMRKGEIYREQIPLTDGRIIQIQRNPMPDGGRLNLFRDITREQVMEHALKQSEERFRDIADATTDWYWETDEELRFTYVSRRFFEVMKVSPDDVIGHTRQEFVTPEQIAEAPEKWQAHFEDLEARLPFRELDYAITGEDGEIRYLRVNAIPVFEEGRFRGYRGADTDITDQKRAELTLKAQNEVIQVTFDNMAQGISMIDWDLNIRFCNRRFLELLDFPEELAQPGMPLEAFFRYNAERGEYGAGDVEEQVRARVELARNFEEHKFERIRPNGQVLEIEGRPVPDVGFVSTYTDITERRRAEEGLEKQAGLIRFLNRIARITNSARNLSQTMIESLETACDFFGWKAGHAYIWPTGGEDRLVSDGIWHVDDEEARWPLMEITVRTEYAPGEGVTGRVMLSKQVECGPIGGTFLSPREQLLLDDGFRFVYAVPVLAQDRVMAVLELFSAEVEKPDAQTLQTLEDVGTQLGRVAERKEAERSLWLAKNKATSANDAKSAFLATMSHEIRTPMNGVMAMAEILEQTDLNEDQRHLSSTIRNSAASLLGIINDILDFSKIEAGKLELEYLGFSLSEAVESVLDLLAPRTSEKNIELYGYIDPALPDHLKSDPTRLRQVLLNLLGNAVKFTETGTIFLEVRGGEAASGRMMLEISVTDTGIGLRPDQIDNLFQQFQQADNSTARKFGGTGLGLAICRHLITMMGGEIGVESEPGKGSRFWFTLPVEVLKERRQSEPVQLDDIRIMLISPHDLIDRAVGSYLRHHGAQVELVTDIDQATERLQEGMEGGGGFDLMMLDDALPGARELADFLDARNRRRDGGHSEILLLCSLEGSRIFRGDTRKLIKPCHREALVLTAGAATGRVEEDEVLIRGAKAKEQYSAPDIEEARAANCLILVAEDNPTNQVVIERQMAQLGFAIEVVPGGREALDHIRKGRYGMLFTDCHMPGMDGFALTRKIRQMEAAGEIGDGAEALPIVALTADAMKDSQEACLAAGMSDFMTKPTDLVTLEKSVRRWLPEAVRIRRLENAGLAAAKGEAPGSAGGAAGETPLLDFSSLTAAFGAIDETAISFLDDFIFSMRDQLSNMAEAADQQDMRGVFAAGHAVKGASLSVGAFRLAAQAQEVEACSKNGTMAEVLELIDQMEDTLEETNAAIPENSEDARNG